MQGEELARYWIGGLPEDQAGGPPLCFETTGGFFLGFAALWEGRCEVSENFP